MVQINDIDTFHPYQKIAHSAELFSPREIERERDLVIVVLSMEEGLLLEDHTGQHASQAPHVQAVVVHLHRGQGGMDAILLDHHAVGFPSGGL